jgi:phytoene dehydrogenase-like protein
VAPTDGFAVPVGGERRLADAMTARLVELGGAARLAGLVARVIIRGKRTCA